MNPVNISESEWEVMTFIWEKAPVAASDVVEALSQSKQWHSRTTRTLLDRLVKKQALKITPEGKRYLYEPLVSMEDCVRRESRWLLNTVFGGQPVSMLLHLVKETKLSPEDIAHLKKILSDKEK